MSGCSNVSCICLYFFLPLANWQKEIKIFSSFYWRRDEFIGDIVPGCDHTHSKTLFLFQNINKFTKIATCIMFIWRDAPITLLSRSFFKKKALEDFLVIFCVVSPTWKKNKIKFCSKSCWRFFPNNARFDPSAKRPRKPASVDIVKPSFRHFDCFFYFLSRQQKTLSVTKWETVLLRKKRIISSLQIQFFISSETGP